MNSSIWFMFAVLAIAIVQSERLDPGPQTFVDNIPAEPNPQKRQTEEIVVYLTPSQIKSLQEGKGYVDSAPVEQAETSQDNQEEPEQPQEDEEVGSLDQLGSLDFDSQLEGENNQLPPSIPVEEPTAEEIDELQQQFSWLYRPPQDRQFVPSPEDNYAYLRYYPETETQTEAAQLESEESEEESEEAQPEVPQQRYRLVPYDYSTESAPTTTEAPQEEPIRERWLRLLEQNRAQLRKAQENAAAATTTTTTEQPPARPESTLARLRFSARYNDQKQAIENEERIKNIIEKQKALIRAEARANTPVVVRKEVTITKQAPVIKHVKVHTPILVPIPEPFEVKVPHPFPVPFDLFRPLAAQASKSKKAEPKKAEAKKSSSARAEEKPKAPKKPSPPAEKPKAERRAPADSKKEVTIEVPSRQRSQPERITIIRHIFEK